MFPPIKDRILRTQYQRPDREALYSELRAHGKLTGLCWLLSPKRKLLRDLPVKAVEELMFTEEYITLPTVAEKLEFNRLKLKVEGEIVNQIRSLTNPSETIPPCIL